MHGSYHLEERLPCEKEGTLERTNANERSRRGAHTTSFCVAEAKCPPLPESQS